MPPRDVAERRRICRELKRIAYLAAERLGTGDPDDDELEDARRRAAFAALEAAGFDCTDALVRAMANVAVAHLFQEDRDREVAKQYLGHDRKPWAAWRWHDTQLARGRMRLDARRRPRCDHRHRRAPGRKPFRRPGSRRATAPTRGDPDEDDPEPPAPAPGARRQHSRGGTASDLAAHRRPTERRAVR